MVDKPSKKIRVLIVDDLQSIITGFTDMLKYCQDFEVVGSARSVESAIARAGELKPDVILLDMALEPDDHPPRKVRPASGNKVIHHLRIEHPEIGILVHTAYDDLIDEAYRSGAHKAYTKVNFNSIEAMEQGIRDTVLRVRREVNPEREDYLKRFSALGKRQKEVYGLLCTGMKNKEIAATLHLSEAVIKQYVSDILSAMGARNRGEAQTFANTHHLFDT
jgi:DNA-binding NarL/FixJ family response regulator